MIFLSFAPNFTIGSALRHLFIPATHRSSANLQSALSARYGGKAYLYYNCRSALSEALRATVPKGSKVAISGLTCYAVVQAVRAAGCTPVYIDIRKSDLHFGAEELEKSAKGCKAIIVQNMLGLPADIAAIENYAEKSGALIIEDLAHSAGIKYADDREAGTIGCVAVLSFGKNKSLDTTHGGALILRQPPLRAPTIAKKSPKLSSRFRDRVYPITGWLIRKTYPIGLGKLIAAFAFKIHLISRSADGSVTPSVRLAHWQSKLALKQLSSLKNSSPLRNHILIEDRDSAIKKLHKHGIFLDEIWYSPPISPARYYHLADYHEDNCPVATQVAKTILNLPSHPATTRKIKQILGVK